MNSFDDVKGWVEKSWEAQGKWREQVADDFNFIDGHQWSDEEKSELDAASRVPIVFNRTAVIIGSVAGSEINNRTEIRYIPREIGDAKPNEILTAGAEWFRDTSNAEDEDSASFADLLACGLGVTETTLDWESDIDGDPSVERIDPLEFGWDHHARRKGLTDARYFFRVIRKPLEELEARFPDRDRADLDATWLPINEQASPHHNEKGDEYAGESESGEPEPRNVATVIQVQWRERVRMVEYPDPMTGQRAEMPADKWKMITQRIPLAMPSREFTKWVWYQGFMGQNSFIEQNQPDPEGSTFNVMTGHWDIKDKRFYGLLRSMRDPQRFANKWLSQTLHIINSNAKGGVMVEADAVVDQSQFEESWSAADGVTWMKSGAISSGRITEKPKAQMPGALMALTEFAISSIRDTSGVNMELLGLRDANQPGVLEYQRRQSAMTTMARFFDSLRFYRKRQGQTILHMLRRHIAPTGRLVRIVKDELVQYVPLAIDDGTARFDVIVDDAPSSPNEKERAWSIIEAMLPVLMQSGMDIDDWADIIEFSPLPSAFADRIREKAKNKQPDPMQMQAAQLQMQETQSKVAENFAQAELDKARAAQVAQEAQLAPIQVAYDLMNPMGASPA